MLLALTTTSQVIRATASVAADLRVSVVYADAPNPILAASSVTYTADVPTAITTTTTTTIVGSPAASATRNIKSITVRNAHASAAPVVTIDSFDATDTTPEWVGTLKSGEWVEMDASGLWTPYDSAGQPKIAPGAGSFIASTLLTSGTSFATSATTRTIRLRMVAGGGGGAGCTSVAAAASAGGGGGAGAYAEKTFAVSPGTAYTYAIGAAGTGASGAAGNNGGATTFTVGGVTVTAPAGQGAPVATAVTTLIAYRGGNQSAVSTNGDLNSAGAPGGMGLIYIAAGAGVSGEGASGDFGAGGSAITAVGNGTAALGFGAGGGGALTGASAVRTGGNGTAGCIFVDEFS